MRRSSIHASVAAAVLVTLGVGEPAAAAAIDCTLRFTIKGWSAFYKTAEGTGIVRCSNGQSVNVKLSARGSGLTVGKSALEDGRGQFSHVGSLDELFGSYVAAQAHASAVKSSGVQVMTKGKVSLALSGTERGVDLGVAFGALTISR